MSAKKKKIVSECPGCNCFVLTRDGDKHKPDCGNPFTESKIPLISPKNGFVSITATLDKRDSYLPPDYFGWSKFENGLVHPETLSTLGVLPRSPLIVVVDDVERVVVVWSCDQVPQLRISLPNCPGEKRVVVHVPKIVNPLNRIHFGVVPSTILPSLDVFSAYLQVYLSNSYLIPGGLVDVKYYGKSYVLTVPELIEDKLNALSLDPNNGNTKKVIKLVSNVSVSVGEEIKKQEIPKQLGFSKIGGLGKAKSELNTFLINPIKNNLEACSIIIWGLTGTGKTLLLNALTEILPNTSLITSSNLSTYQKLSESDSVLLMDNFEVKPETKNSGGTVDVLCQILDGKKFKAVVLAVRSIEILDLKLRRRFPVEIELMVPSPDERLDILKMVLEGEKIDDSEIKELARNTHGFTGADLAALAKVASHCPSEDPTPEIHVDRFTAARRRIRPTGIRQFVLEVPDVKWEDIGGEFDLKREIEQAVIWPFKHPEAFKRLGVEPPSGILLYGPPGCSKTLIARALAAQSKLNFLSVKGPELFSKWVGESERAVRELFHRARQVAPTVLFFDEIDAVAVKRGGDSSSGVSDRVLAQLLTELDGLEKSTGVIVLAATNRPDTLDGAILRPGRLDRVLYVPLPDLITRKSIFELQLKKMSCSTNVDVEELAEKTNGYSGAEIVALCKNAGFLAMREQMDATEISWNHFVKALDIILPRTDKKALEVYEKFSKGIQL